MSDKDEAIVHAEERRKIIEEASRRFEALSEQQKQELKYGFQQAIEQAQFIIDGGPRRYY